MLLSSFLRYINENRIPSGLLAEVKREARARVVERLQAGRADCELTFTDLWERCEKAVAPQ